MRFGSSLPGGPRYFLLGSLILTAICAGIEIICRFVLHMHYPFNFPILNPGAITPDLLALEPHFKHLHHVEFFDIAENNYFIYPAPMALPYAFFFLLPGYERALFYGFSLIVVAVSAMGLGRAMVRRGVPARHAGGFLAACFILSYPFWFELKQGNVEIVVFSLCAFGVWAFLHHRGWSAAACFGVAGSMKLFPFILLGLLLARRQYRKTLFAAGVACATTLVSLWVVYPSIGYTWTKLNASVADFRFFYMQHFLDEIGFDHSIWAFIRFFLPRTLTPVQLGHGLNLYLAVGLATGITIYFLRIRHLPAINQILCLVLASILLTPVSFDYTLIHLYTPWALCVVLALDAARSHQRVPGLAAAFALLTLLCSPETEVIRHGVTVEGQIKTVLLLGLFVVGLRYPLALPPGSTESALLHPSGH